MSNDFGSYDDLLDRVTHSIKNGHKKVVFLLGSPVSSPRGKDDYGVPDINGIVDLIKEKFDGSVKDNLDQVLSKEGVNRYQAAMDFLLKRRGQDEINNIIKMAVLGSHINCQKIRKNIFTFSKQDELISLETNVSDWVIPPCLIDLAKICVKYPTICNLQLTTNFDPLLSLALKKEKGIFYRSVLSRDGNLNQTQAEGTHIVHLHGYWYGVDTLHTPRQLLQDRPKLKSCISNLIKNSIIIPIAYSGWDDIFTKTLLDLIREEENKMDILWTYYSNSSEEILKIYKNQLEDFNDGINSGRLLLYKGIDCHLFFNDLNKALSENEIDNVTDVKVDLEPLMVSDIDIESLYDKSKELLVSKLSDPIPSVVSLIGRETELDILTDSNLNIISISGIGGQGKTSLAAYFSTLKSLNFDFIDWRDCREQNNTFYNILLRSTTVLYKGLYKIEELSVLSVKNLCEVLIRLLEEKKGLIVFDNVDQYINLETGEPVHELKIFFDEIQNKQLKSKILITSRPELKIENDVFYSLVLKGLSIDSTRILFSHKAQKKIEDKILYKLMTITEGHPLWISLIASKHRHENISIEKVLEKISSGKGELPDRTIKSMWDVLNDKQKTTIRTLAELERPISEDEFLNIDVELNFNQLNKALKVLKSLSLIEIKEEKEKNKILLDLHPLIRQYIRKNFARNDRYSFIAKIILVIDRKISALKDTSDTIFSIDMLDLWIHKVDLNLNKNDLPSAINGLVDIHNQLLKNSKKEEFVRLAVRIFDEVDWKEHISKVENFSKLWSLAIHALVELEKYELADSYIEKFENNIQGISNQTIILLDVKCYRYWFQQDFDQAIYFGSEGCKIKKNSNIDTSADCSHNLALAWRDNGNISQALAYFLGGVDENEVIEPNIIDNDRDGSFYGNIGRCYFFLRNYDYAMIAYKKSACLLEKKQNDNLLNRGYIRLWFAELLLSENKTEDAIICFRAAWLIWNGCVPARISHISNMIDKLIEENQALQKVINYPYWKLESRFAELIK